MVTTFRTELAEHFHKHKNKNDQYHNISRSNYIYYILIVHINFYWLSPQYSSDTFRQNHMKIKKILFYDFDIFNQF